MQVQQGQCWVVAYDFSDLELVLVPAKVTTGGWYTSCICVSPVCVYVCCGRAW